MARRRPLDPFYIYVAREMMQHHAAHELMACRAYAAFRRRTKSRELAALAGHISAEEREHYALLRSACPPEWGPFDAGVKARLARRRRVPSLGSELEFLVASWIFDYAGLVQIEAVTASSFAPYRRVARRILKEELEHGDGGYRRLAAYLEANPGRRARAQTLVAKWTRFSLASFGADDSLLDKLSLKHGLKRTRASALRRKFLRMVAKQSGRLFR